MSTAYRVIHSIPGRLRLRYTGGTMPLYDAQETLEALPGVVYCRLNIKCKSMVVRFDAATLNKKALLDAITPTTTPQQGGMPAHAPPVCPATGPDTCACPAPSRDKETSIRPQAIRFGILSAAGAMLLGRQLLLGAAAPALLSPFGLAVVYGATPLLKRMAKDVKRRKVSLQSFLGGAIVGAAAVREITTALEVLWIDAGADLLTAYMNRRSRRSIKSMLKETAHHTFVVQNGVEVEVPTAQLAPGDVVALHAGERIPVDGHVIFGNAMVDASAMTGRAAVETFEQGDYVYAGCVVRQGVIHVVAHCVGEDTYMARIFAKVEAGLANRSDIEKLSDKLAQRTIRLGFWITGATFLVTGSFMRAFTVLLVMACPCATSLSASSAINAAVAGAAKKRIIIKGGRPLEQFSKVDAICLDKTGTLTGIRPTLAAIHTMNGQDPSALLQLALSAEAHNHHPLAEAIKDHALAQGLSPSGHEQCEYYLGQGVHAKVEGQDVFIGNYKLLERFSIPFPHGDARIESMQANGLTVLYLARHGHVEGLFGIANQVRGDSAGVVKYFKERDVAVHLVTGDEAHSANALARDLAIQNVLVSALPEDKADHIARLQAEGEKVAMVGDGVNDALALVHSEVGVALGSHGNEAALEAADIALMDDDLRGVAEAHALSQQTLTVIYNNFRMATASNVLGSLAGLLGLMGPVAAGFLHVGHTAAVLFNSSSLLRQPPLALPAGSSKPDE